MVTAAASILMCNPIVFLIILALFVAIVAMSRFISLGSIMCALLYPVLLNGFDVVVLKHPNPYIVFPILMAVLVVVKHKENIKRLLEGKENKLSFKRNEDK